MGCQAALLPGAAPISDATTLTIEATVLGNGEFDLAGTTNLPNNTQLTALALRYLDPDAGVVTGQPAVTAPGDTPLYSVLDYQTVTVADGQWATRLNTWQVSADGRYQEPWQAQAKSLNLAAQPRGTVHFAITLAPDQLALALGQVRAHEGRRQVTGVLRMTSDGEPFLWADQSLPIGLPQGQTTPPDDLLARTNGGWGQRYLLVPEPPLPYTLTPLDERQTTAPTTPEELLR
ncbi:hypothetical protein IQ254_15280 [Nodosilinea sp. LEGE 07088]|uniref:hypothetical protein n=1 Tax=Nodosilinea sp. LEGE 07088 TaxID=2777968 RepID=UPI001882C3A0|nr:hypothetical protein [Nodosilinea sp. LEGE 07088]MBE9138536.1 hypothetical protein [Nodosilinea sp. LEGE 07088]